MSWTPKIIKFSIFCFFSKVRVSTRYEYERWYEVRVRANLKFRSTGFDPPC
uniref:Uncharacterized protein n=1 Tax=Meloidogyne enterolobii TaxID=390850 RepID=A0A6V7VQ23_MELEN|nr:unnamed protein product [Meloidogyne enterolobii]